MACNTFLLHTTRTPTTFFAKPISNLKDETIIEAFESVFNELKDKGHKPTFNVTDNQCTKPIKAFLKKENCKW